MIMALQFRFAQPDREFGSGPLRQAPADPYDHHPYE